MSPGLLNARNWLAGCLVIMLLCLPVAACLAAPEGLDDLAGPLKAIALSAERGALNTASVARLGIQTQGDLIRVRVLFRSAAAAAATGLGKYGAQTKQRRDRRVIAMIPADKLREVAALPQVAQVSVPSEMIPLQGYGANCSEGVQLTQATAMHLAGSLGQDVKVAVIDTGFADLPLAEVPANLASPDAIISFRTDGSTTASAHGSAVAMIIADMAPACSMTLIAVDTAESIESALDYVIQKGIKYVNMSLGLVEGPFDGTHPLSQAIDRANAAGILWVTASGNFAQQHWKGSWQDRDRDGFIEFNGSDENMQFDLPAGQFAAYLSWFASAGETTWSDYDLVLYDSTGAKVASSAVTQNGDDPPQEILLAYVAAAGLYDLRIQYMGEPGSVSGEEFKLFTPGFDIESTLQTRDDSLSIPAEAEGAFTVGATRGSSLVTTGPLATVAIDRIEPFSSRGPAGVVGKPEIVAPDAVTIGAHSGGLTALNPFFGTSAAAPHVAGAAALLASEDPQRSASTVRNLLLQLAEPIAPPDIPVADVNAYGAGRVALRVGTTSDAEPPVVQIKFPVNNSTVTVASPRVTAVLQDAGGINPDSIQVWLDDAHIVSDGAPSGDYRLSQYVLDAETGDLSFLLSDLTRTRHTIRMRCNDLSGNESAEATCSFRISTPTIAAGLHIIGLPYPFLGDASPGEVFGVPDSDVVLIRWVPSDSRPSKYHIYPDELAGFSPPDDLVAKPPAGLGYFLSLPSTGTLNLSSAALTDDSYQIKLVNGDAPPRGWNLIGNPYEQHVDWGSVEFISANGRQDLREAIGSDGGFPVTEGVIFSYVSSGNYYSFSPDPTQATMEPLKGYWLHVLKDATLVVYNSSATAAATPRAPAERASAISEKDWMLQLEARAGKYQDPVNYIGVSAAATDGYDVGVDISEPPPMSDALRMYMPAAAGDLAKEMRSPLGSEQTWNLEVACRLKNVPITISWPQVNASVPRGVTLRLTDLDSGTEVYMRTSNGYTFTQAEPGVRRLQVTASTTAEASLALTGLAAVPNRGGQVTLSYTVSRAAEVTAEIRNISGVLVRTLGKQGAAPGTTQTLLWNGQSDRGVRAPAGKYLARITARAADGQTVQAIRPFAVTR